MLSNQEVVSFVRRRIAQKMEPEEVSLYLFNVLGAEVLSKMNEIDFIKFNDVDIIRHSLVRKIANAYEKNSKQSDKSEK